MEHREYQELLASHALDALDARDAQALRAHLATCAECRNEFDELSDAAALLAHEAEPLAPSDDVRRRIMRDIRSLPRSADEAPIMPLSQGLSAAWPNVWRLAAVFAFVALLLGIIVLWRRDTVSRRQIAELARQLDQQQSQLQVERHNLAQQAEAVALLNSPDAKRISLAGTPTAQLARATFVYDEKSRNGVLLIEGLPDAPANKAYEVWFIPKGLAPIPGRTFTVNANGRALVSHGMPVAPGSSSVIAITLEPKNGSTAPTGPIYLASPAL